MNKTGLARFAMLSSLVSDMVTDHFRRIATLGPDEKFTVTYIDMEDDVTVMDGTISEERTHYV